MTNTLIITGQKLLRELLSIYLKKEMDMLVTLSEKGGQELLNQVHTITPDLILIDFNTIVKDELQLIKAISHQSPQTKLLLIESNTQNHLFMQMMNSGVHGFIHKSESLDSLNYAIRKVLNAELYISSKTAEMMVAKQKGKHHRKRLSLTPREIDVLRLIIKGKTAHQISNELFIANSTVITHRKHLLKKTNSPNTKALISYALEHQLC